jgi:energy-coupling factor transporter ATP-binding protein EcfA2
MYLRHLRIQNFRGIKSCEWSAIGDFACLIGPGDSGKTTILDAIQFVLYPSWSLNLDDSDFYECDPNNTITIDATIVNFPSTLGKEDRFGLLKRGWDATSNTLIDEPTDETTVAITVRLTVDDTLEPKWTVYNERSIEERFISPKDRQLLSMFRLGEQVERELAWGRGSALAQMIQSNGEIKSFLNEINREIRGAGAGQIPDSVKQTATRVEELAKQFAVKPKSELIPSLDAKYMSTNTGLVGLHDGVIPTRLYGTGSKRLIALASQLSRVEGGGIILIDEIELGLEPHRLRRLIDILREKTSVGSGLQIIVTTHSSVALAHVGAGSIWHLNSDLGVLKVQQVSMNMQPTVRNAAAFEAFFARRIVVCEGKTETGLAYGAAYGWSNNEHREPIAVSGLVLVNGEGGSKFIKTALDFKDLRYEVGVFMDGDVFNDDSNEVTGLRSKGVDVIRWKNSKTEERIFQDSPWELIFKIMEMLFAGWGGDVTNSYIDDLKKRTSCNSLTAINLKEWPSIVEEIQLRTALSAAASASKSSWIKNSESAIKVGRLLAENLDLNSQTELCHTLLALKTFIYEL